MPVRLQFRRGTFAQWAAVNPVLAQGELALETDTNKFKIGDGATAWNSLPYTATQSAAYIIDGGTPFTNYSNPAPSFNCGGVN